MDSRIYVRDKRSLVPESETTSKVMSANRGKDTRPEMIMRKALREAGFPGYRLQWKVAGKPDIAYPGRKVAIFVNGCFWHRCPKCDPSMPRSHSEFWKAKFDRNVERDRRNVSELESQGWTVITIWECEVKHSLDDVMTHVTDVLIDRQD